MFEKLLVIGPYKESLFFLFLAQTIPKKRYKITTAKRIRRERKIMVINLMQNENSLPKKKAIVKNQLPQNKAEANRSGNVGGRLKKQRKPALSVNWQCGSVAQTRNTSLSYQQVD